VHFGCWLLTELVLLLMGDGFLLLSSQGLLNTALFDTSGHLAVIAEQFSSLLRCLIQVLENHSVVILIGPLDHSQFVV
jgi:hypothetical protein